MDRADLDQGWDPTDDFTNAKLYSTKEDIQACYLNIDQEKVNKYVR